MTFENVIVFFAASHQSLGKMRHTLKLWMAKLEHRTTKQGICQECFQQHFGSNKESKVSTLLLR